MLKSELVKRLLRALIALLGAGVAVAVNLAGIRLWSWAQPGEALPVMTVVLSYVISALVGGGVFFLFSEGIIRRCVDMGTAVERYLDHMTMAQLLSCLFGLMSGMIIAALLSQILMFMGASMFTTAFSAILYVLLGVTGFSVGWRRSDDLAALVDRAITRGAARRSRRHGEEAGMARPKILSLSALMDGRIAQLCRVGFVEGDVIVPAFLLAELRQMADSADALRRNQGRRGLETISRIRKDGQTNLRMEETDYPDLSETDMKLLRLTQEAGGVLITGDGGQAKMAAVAGVRALNLHDLTQALRPMVMAGEELTVSLTKEGKEPGQGVGYLPDGAMVVVEGGKSRIGETVRAVVTSVLHTSAGQMIFARTIPAEEG